MNLQILHFFFLFCRPSPNVDLELKNKGIHMDVVEPEKLRWMEEVPEIKHPLPQAFYSARFDFEGNLSNPL